MNEGFLKYLIKDGLFTNIGPTSKEIFLQQAEHEYCNGNVPMSIFYQTLSLYQSSQEQYSKKAEDCEQKVIRSRRSMPETINTLLKELNAKEISEFSNNSLIHYACNSLKKISESQQNNKCPLPINDSESCNFLRDITDPSIGFAKIEEICQQFPNEWTILQLCKGPRTDTSYNIYPKIHESDAAIYMTIFKHARSHEYTKPLCLQFSRPEQKDLYKDFAGIVNRFKECVKIAGKTIEDKKLYWTLLGELNVFIAEACTNLSKYFYPWTFLFTGISNNNVSCKYWGLVDQFCNLFKWEDDARVLLSLAASNITALSLEEIEAICEILAVDPLHKHRVTKLLVRIKEKTLKAGVDLNNIQHFPCVLVIDERLDHFFWEEINVHQEFTRVNSLQSLWRLYRYYKADIRQGYLNVNITDGACLLNPDNNLPKMESRMRSFFEYWMPHWRKIIGQRPKKDELFRDYLNRSCYVYAGHGSGLQYINGRNITKHQTHCVVFLFGCDSSRLTSNGLYSELVGPHLYYHAAMCPALVGTLMSGLDCNMDMIATEILSRWIAPKSKSVVPWNQIDERAWTKEFVIKPLIKAGEELSPPPSMAATPQYNIGSLCRILAKVHQRLRETKLYNTVPYVCRGLPVWNCSVESLPLASTVSLK